MFLDTSVIVEVLVHGKDHRRTFQEILEELDSDAEDEDFEYISIIQLAEISDWCTKNSILEKEGIQNAKKLSRIVVPLDENICETAGVIKFERRRAGYSDFGLIDAIILASARSVEQRLLTLDPHFDGERDCIVLKPSRKYGKSYGG
jgi:predicted nucleic acid-binding protein